MNKTFEIEVIEECGLEDIADVKLPDPTLLDYYTRRKNRCILWNDEIEDGFVEIYQDILRWNKEDIDNGVKPEDAKPIKIYINSDGGSVSAVFAIMSEFEYAAVVCNMLKENYPQIFIAKPV